MEPQASIASVASRRTPPAPPVDPAEPSEERSVAPRWSLAKRILFRFAFAYFLLCTVSYLPYFLPLPDVLAPLWSFLIPRVADVFHVDTSVLPNGSGDTTYNYVQVFCFLVLALGATAVWTLLDRKRLNYVWLHEGFRVYVRFVLAFWMLQYGAIKVIPLQGGSLTLDRLLQPFGDSSLHSLFWTFFGASAAYKIFSGAAEMLGGLLLVARRTTLLGALVCVGVLIHVVVLNLCYDVPVKLFSSHLLAMAVFLTLPDLRRLADLLVFNRRIEPAEIRPLVQRKWLHWSGLALRAVFILAFAAIPLYQNYQFKKQLDHAPKPPLYGIWNVEEFVLDGQARPPLFTDETRWRRVVFDSPHALAILTADSRQRFGLDLEPGSHRLTLTRQDDPSWKSTLSYQRLDPSLLAIEGTFDGHRIQARLHRTETPRFRLVSRGSHWINEYPDEH
jgi:hypothetical protein